MMLGLALVLAVGVAVPGGVFVGLVTADLGSVSGAPHGTGDDAVWLGHDWVAAGFSPAKLDPLVARIEAGGFRDVFVHVGPLSDNGSWNVGLAPKATAPLAAVRQRLPGVRVQARGSGTSWDRTG